MAISILPSPGEALSRMANDEYQGDHSSPRVDGGFDIGAEACPPAAFNWIKAWLPQDAAATANDARHTAMVGQKTADPLLDKPALGGLDAVLGLGVGLALGLLLAPAVRRKAPGETDDKVPPGGSDTGEKPPPGEFDETAQPEVRPPPPPRPPGVQPPHVAGWRFAGARHVGASHAKRGEPCQDAMRTWSDGDAFALAVSDGAGSARRSHEGSQRACDLAIELIGERLGTYPGTKEDLLVEVARTVRANIRAAARDAGHPIGDYACTLLLAVQDRSGGAAAQIGDGVIAVREADDKEWSWVFWPQKGEYANVTRFITDIDAKIYLQTAPLPPFVVEIVAMTDGLESLALDLAKRSTHRRFFEMLMKSLRAETGQGHRADISQELEAFLGTPHFQDRSDDDLTVVLAAASTS